MNDSELSTRTTRLAPSPTGALHLGNARTFLVNYLLARRRNWRILMRMEDLDSPRVKPWAAQQAIDDLQWLGITWDTTVARQSDRGAAYRDALDELVRSGDAYPCVCSRKDIQQASAAPHRDDHITAYPGLCRGKYESASQAEELTGRPAAWRVRVDTKPVVFRNEGMAGYQLAVVVDDAQQGVDVIVRGDDLLDSAARQIHLRRLLKLGPEPEYWHVPLVTGPDGRRLAKRHGDTRLSHYRQMGVSPRRILGLLAFMCGLSDQFGEMDMPELMEIFDLSKLPANPVIFDDACESFLTDG
ncbi:MAG: glutamate--tRNA ligase family protein [Phycisphaerae bacterium]|jgi:glutamyl-tRNA synthetase|nr:glutamate--tRNA ligase family protein [Phycisphaerae bacterium]